MKIIAIDFDNCLSLHGKFPDIGDPNTKLFEYLIRRQSEGDSVILWTCREDEDLEKAVQFCKDHGLNPDYVNENHPRIVEAFGKDTRKIFANMYIDDLAKTPWDVIDYKPKPKPEKPETPLRRARIVR